MAASAPSSSDLAARTASQVVAVDPAEYAKRQEELLAKLNSPEASQLQNTFLDMITQMGEKLGPDESLMSLIMDGKLDGPKLRSLIPDSVNGEIAAANPDIPESEREENLLSMLSTIARGVEMFKQGIQKTADDQNDPAQGLNRAKTMLEGDTLESIFSKGPTDPNASLDALSSALRGMSLDGPGVPPEIKHFQEMMKNPPPAPVAGVQIADAEDAKARVAQFESSVKDFIAALRPDSVDTQKLQHAMNGVIVRPLTFGAYQKDAAEAISKASKGIDKIIEGMAHVLTVKQMPAQLPALGVIFSAKMLKPLEDQAPPTADELEEVLTETIPKINEVIDKFAASEAAARTKAEERAQALLTEELD